MDTLKKNEKSYTASLRDYAIELLEDRNSLEMSPLSPVILDTILALPTGEKEEQFVMYALECGRLEHEMHHRKAA